MIIYNVTTQVATAQATGWLQWMQQDHIPAVLHTGCFTGYRMVQLLEVDETEGLTYAVQYEAPDKQAYENYITHYAPELRKASEAVWGNTVFSFRTLMKVVEAGPTA